jgi:hypothetical protein
MDGCQLRALRLADCCLAGPAVVALALAVMGRPGGSGRLAELWLDGNPLGDDGAGQGAADRGFRGLT